MKSSLPWRIFTLLIFASSLFSFPVQKADAQQGVTSGVVAAPAACTANGKARTTSDPLTGRYTFIGTTASNAIPRASFGAAAGAAPESAARSYLNTCGSLFGVRDPSSELTVQRQSTLDRGRSMVHFQQTVQGIPVVGGEMIVNMDGSRNVLSVNGEISSGFKGSTTPGINAARARSSALGSVANKYDISSAQLTASMPEPWIYDPSLITPESGPVILVWRLEVKASGAPIDEFVLVDASDGSIALSFNQIDAAQPLSTISAAPVNLGNSWSVGVNSSKSLTPGIARVAVYDMNHKCQTGDSTCTGSTGSLPGTLLCGEGSATLCSTTGVPDAINAYNFAVDTYNFYYTANNRDSLNNAGLVIKAVINYGVNYGNAFWDGQQIVFGTNWASALDVVAHELSHGVTSYESNLFYYYQSGAINESFSDLWGEFTDRTYDGDTTWLLGEDSPAGAIRNMADPSTVYHHPDKITSGYFYSGPNDNGGVHTNSGVNNKAAYLLAQSGTVTFNSHTVTGIGITKTAKVYYEVQTNLLTSGADYHALSQALYQGCLNLVGTSGIMSTDCAQVQNAILAVEMNTAPPSRSPYATPKPALCDSGLVPHNLFFNDFETGIGNFTYSAPVDTRVPATPNIWMRYAGDAYSGIATMTATDYAAVTRAYMEMSSPIILPAGSSYLSFAHSFIFGSPTYPWDGGVVEYSESADGTTWSPWANANALFLSNPGGLNWYNGTIASGTGNPLQNQPAFVKASQGYVISRLSLTSLEGKQVKFRWGIGTEGSNGGYVGMYWFVDDVRLFTCVNPPASFGKTAPSDAATDQSPNPTLSWQTSANSSSYEYCISTSATDCRTNPNWTSNGTGTSVGLTNLGTNTTFYWQVRALNADATTYANGGNPLDAVYWSFTTVFGKLGPANVGTVYTLTPTLTWQVSPGADYYEYCYRLSGPCQVGDWTSSGTNPSFTIPTLNPGDTIYWNVRAHKGAGYVYSDGGGDDWSFTVTPCFTLTIPTPTNGTVNQNPTPNCNSNTQYLSGTSVTLSAVPATNFHLQSWGGDGSGYTYSLPVTMNADKTVSATFEPFFVDVPPNYTETLGGVDYNLRPYIEALWNNGFTNGCWVDPITGDRNYCPSRVLNRAEIAKFLLNVLHGKGYVAPPLPASPAFTDEADIWATPEIGWSQTWVEELYIEGLTNGCWASPLRYCPTRNLRRGEAVKFGLTMKYGPSYVPNPATWTIYADDLLIDGSDWAAPWIEQAYRDNLLPPCGIDAISGKPLFCAANDVDRAWEAYVIIKSLGLTLP